MQKQIFKKPMDMHQPPSLPAIAGAPQLVPSQDPQESDDESNWTPDTAWQQYFDHMSDVRLPNSEDVFRVYFGGPQEGPLFVLFHGGGHSALSWALTASILKDTSRVMAFDFRGHDLSMEALTNDAIALINTIYGDNYPPAIILAGHSLGGSVAVHVAISGQIRELIGVIVLDVVEGTATASLKTMDRYLARVPNTFPSLKKAIQWGVRYGNIHNRDSARVSIPPRLVHSPSDQLYHWRTNLHNTNEFWAGWYEGLSKKFLSCSAAKVLILAGTDRLDTELTIAQMQGKFRLVVLPECGHHIQEDNPEKTAEILLELKKRYDIIASKTSPRITPTISHG